MQSVRLGSIIAQGGEVTQALEIESVNKALRVCLMGHTPTNVCSVAVHPRGVHCRAPYSVPKADTRSEHLGERRVKHPATSCLIDLRRQSGGTPSVCYLSLMSTPNFTAVHSVIRQRWTWTDGSVVKWSKVILWFKSVLCIVEQVCWTMSDEMTKKKVETESLENEKVKDRRGEKRWGWKKQETGRDYFYSVIWRQRRGPE